jgi:protein involved in polysaccharide export with SLBB domain
MRIFNVSSERLFFSLLAAFLLPGFASNQIASQSLGDAGSQAETPRTQASPAKTESPSTTVEPSLRFALPAGKLTEIISAAPGLIDDLKRDAVEQFHLEPDLTDAQFYALLDNRTDIRAFLTQRLKRLGYVGEEDFNQDEPVRQDEGFNQEGASREDRSSADRVQETSEPSRRRASRSSLPRTGKEVAEIEPLGRATPYRSIPSLRDLYTQYPYLNRKLARFGSDFFLNGSQNAPNVSDLSAGPDYILGTGDQLDVDLWGSVNRHLSVKVDRDGKITLPEIGSITVAGRRMGDAQRFVESSLSQQLKNIGVNLALARIRTVRVYVVGDVARPGAYDISALSTPLNAIYAAGGPTSFGSMRMVRHFRMERLVGETDLYDLMLHGLNKAEEHFESGDTVLVPPVGKQITVSGLVRRPAIYELRSERDLAEILDLAGGIQITGTLKHIRIERVRPHSARTMLEANVSDSGDDAVRKTLELYPVQDGDIVTVLPIISYSESAVYLDGHVFLPGKYPYREGMKLTDLVQSFQDLLPEAADTAEIIRLEPPDNHPNTISVNLTAMLTGKESPIALMPLDTLRVRGRYEIDAPIVYIYGEVARPGKYPMSDGMTAAGLVRLAGGVLRSATTDRADLASYTVTNGTKVVTDTRTVEIGKALAGVPDTDIRLHPNDVLTVRTVSGWNQIGASISINGEVQFPGTYGIQEGERLSSVLKRAGGFLPNAYPAGAVLERVQVKEIAEQRKQELIRRIRSEGATLRVDPRVAGQDQNNLIQSYAQQQQQIIAQLESQPADGRLVIHLSKDIKSWEGTPFDIEVRPRDQLTIPRVPNFVSVSGQVFNESSFTYLPQKKVGWYLSQAGGARSLADRKNIIVIRADGSVVSSGSAPGWLKTNVLDMAVRPGDTVFVPSKVLGGSQAWKNVAQTAQIISAMAIAAGVALQF